MDNLNTTKNKSGKQQYEEEEEYMNHGKKRKRIPI